jgi:DNA-binding transcriptional MerR regulator
MHLYTLDEVAEYVGRTPQLLRLYYSQGLLPDPKTVAGSAKKKIRKFTLDEANQLKNFFASVKKNSLIAKRKRADRRRIENGR